MIIPTDFDPNELLPADAPLGFANDLQAAVGLLSNDDASEDDTPLPFGRTWAFDFETGQFLRHGTAPAVVNELDGLRVWIEKTLRTARGAHPIYSENYGTDFPYEGIGEPFSAEAVGVLTTAISEALLVHDRILDVTEFTFTGDLSSDVLFVNFRVLVDDEELEFADVPVGESF